MERYTIEGTLGSGGMATVYLARHNQIGSLHAVKVLQVLTPSIRERLLQEGRVQGAMQHPNIVSVTDMVEVDATPALVLEYVRGPSLAQLLSSKRPSLAQADELARGILRGASFAHRHGLIHRDLKPGNILLAIRDGELAPKITDFGLAKIVAGPAGRHETRTGVGLGTPSYMAPEQIRDAAHVDQRADVFSLGAILYELVTGRLCFEGADKMDTFQRICDGRFDNPRALVPNLPERMARAIEEALRVDPEDRPHDAGGLLALWTGQAEGLSSELLVSSPGDAWTEEILKSAEALAPTDESIATPPVPSGEPTFAVSLDFTPGPAPNAQYLTQPSLIEEEPTSSEPSSLAPEDPTRQALLAAVGAALFGAPFLLGALVVVFGSFGAAMAAPGVALFFGIALAGIAAAGAFATAPPRVAVAWVLAPTALGVAGNIVLARTARTRLQEVAAAGLADKAERAATGVAEALAADMASMTLVTFLLLVVADAAAIGAVRCRGSLGPLFTPRRVATVATASLASTLLWLVSLSQDGGPGPFVILATLCICGLGCAAIAFPTPDERVAVTRFRVLVALGTTVGVVTAAKVLYLQRLAWLFSEVKAGEDRLAAASAFASSLASTRMEVVAAWGAAALLTALIPFLGVGKPTRLPWGRELGLAALLALPLLGSKLAADRAISALASEVLPAFLDEEADAVLGMQLTDGQRADLAVRLNALGPLDLPEQAGELGGATVVDPGASGLRAGDVLTSVESRPIAGVHQLLRTLKDCRCGAEQACALSRCLRPGDRVAARVLRGGELADVTLPVPFGQEPGAPEVAVARFAAHGLSLEAPASWGLSAMPMAMGEGTTISVSTDKRAPVGALVLDHRGAPAQTLAGFAEGILRELAGDPTAITSQPATSRRILGVPSEARAVTVRGERGVTYYEFHRVEVPGHVVLATFNAPAGQRAVHEPDWAHLLETLAVGPTSAPPE